MSAVTVTIGADTGPFNRAVKGLGSSLGGLRGIAAGALAGFGAKGIIDVVSEMDSLRRAMTTLEGSAEKGAARMNELKEAAKLPGVAFEQALRGDIKLRSVGVSAEMSKNALIEFGNALSLAGGSSADLDGVILALTQIISKGKVSAEEINQIAERVPQVRAVMKDIFGTADTEALQKMGLEADEFVENLIGGFGNLQRASAGVSEKLDGIATAIKIVIDQVASGFVNAAVGDFSKLGDAADSNAQSFRELGEAIAGVWSVAKTTGEVITSITRNIGDVVGIAGLMAGGMSLQEANAVAQEANQRRIDESAEAAAAAAKPSPKPAASAVFNGKNMFEVATGALSNFFTSDTFKTTGEEIRNALKDSFTQDSEQRRDAAKNLADIAFSPLKGDADRSFGRGGNINPLIATASKEMQEMIRQSNLLKNQADKLDKSNILLGDIKSIIANLRSSASYN